MYGCCSMIAMSFSSCCNSRSIFAFFCAFGNVSARNGNLWNCLIVSSHFFFIPCFRMHTNVRLLPSKLIGRGLIRYLYLRLIIFSVPLRQCIDTKISSTLYLPRNHVVWSFQFLRSRRLFYQPQWISVLFHNSEGKRGFQNSNKSR